MTRNARRHPADVTADRLSDHYEHFHGLMDGQELDDLSHTIHVLREIADGTRVKDGYQT